MTILFKMIGNRELSKYYKTLLKKVFFGSEVIEILHYPPFRSEIQVWTAVMGWKGGSTFSSSGLMTPNNCPGCDIFYLKCCRIYFK